MFCVSCAVYSSLSETETRRCEVSVLCSVYLLQSTAVCQRPRYVDISICTMFCVYCAIYSSLSETEIHRCEVPVLCYVYLMQSTADCQRQWYVDVKYLYYVQCMTCNQQQSVRDSGTLSWSICTMFSVWHAICSSLSETAVPCHEVSVLCSVYDMQSAAVCQRQRYLVMKYLYYVQCMTCNLQQSVRDGGT